MFERRQQTTLTGAAFNLAELVFHTAVRSVRKNHRNAIFAILTSILQTVILVGVFYLMYEILPGLRGIRIRGDFLLYIMTGIFMYMVHIKSLAAVMGADGPSSPMMQHLPMNTAVSIGAAALGALYVQTLSLVTVLFVYHIGWGPITIANPVGAMGMVLLAWFSGTAVGVVLLALRPWLPGAASILQQFYTRLNMFASGKMFVANQMPAHMVAMFAWNPLYHIIDQVRGFVFVNYTPLKSGITYPIVASVIILTIGFMGENFSRKRVSASWGAGR